MPDDCLKSMKIWEAYQACSYIYRHKDIYRYIYTDKVIYVDIYIYIDIYRYT